VAFWEYRIAQAGMKRQRGVGVKAFGRKAIAGKSLAFFPEFFKTGCRGDFEKTRVLHLFFP
jgi:hypothetical protein